LKAHRKKRRSEMEGRRKTSVQIERTNALKKERGREAM